ncbi:TPA: outer membrane protein [Legionella pneumophila]|uniref:outer membrane protein n=1 Tax=Legionella pneumophila TaxID=446 RepID=UPI00026DA08D|nr:hypothetical protein [Legionella pneumophila]ANH13782.1 hypothetical protein A5478_12370 [Legionella pneumophila]ANH16745.1 hypothetical protein A5480_12365 [Legionella pneumophila]ANH19722.1 hypothetical protein A5479_12420 [Legionella pneumophila]APX20598.1 hypothetical protein A1D14_12365 [Legionella pneumophila]AQL12776.1 hypothetical protein A1D13_12365 [Legionella pneumophila]
MNKKLSLIALCASSLSLHAGTMGEVVSPTYPWFASIGTGYSWTEKPGIVNPNPVFWDFSLQGYDSDLGDRGFYTFAVGKQIHRYIDISLSYLDHEVFNYQKFQTSLPGTSGTPGFTGSSRTRYFELDNKALLVNGYLHPAQAWTRLASIDLTPFIDGGIGYARNEVRNFYTVGTATVAGVAIGSTSSIGEPVNKNSFAWQASAGLNFHPTGSHLSIDAGYRYYDGGQFNGPSVVYTNSDGFQTGTPWSGRLKANQIFVDFKYTV